MIRQRSRNSVHNLRFDEIDFRFGPERKIANNTYAGIEVTGRTADRGPIGWSYVKLHRTVIVLLFRSGFFR